jgi:hypothetical protein
MGRLRLFFVISLGFASAYVHADDSGPFSPLTFENGILFSHPEKEYEVRFRFRVQNLLRGDFPSQGSSAPATISGQVRRLRLRLMGFLGTPRLQYSIQLSFSRGDMDWDATGFPNLVRDASLIYEVLPSWRLSFGQTKLPGNRQRVVSSGDLQLVDRSTVNRLMNLDRDFGIQSLVSQAHWNFRAAVSTGEGRNSPGQNTGLAYTVRAEWLPLGAFQHSQDYTESDLEHEPELRMSFGIGTSLNQRSLRSQAQLGADLSREGLAPRTFQTHFADGILKFRGTSLQFEYLERHLREGNSPRLPSFQGRGGMIQGGQVLGEVWEPVARISWVRASKDARAVFPDLLESTLGLNYFFRGHRMKIQCDFTEERRYGSSAEAARIPLQYVGRIQTELGL